MRFSEYLDRAAGLYPAQEAFVDGDLRLDYKSTRDIVHKIANCCRIEQSRHGLVAHELSKYS